MELTEREQTIIGSTMYRAFDLSDWEELFGLCEETDYLDEYPRFLKSVQWDDPDAKGNCINATKYLLKRNYDETVEYLNDHYKFRETLSKKDMNLYNKIFDDTADIEDIDIAEELSDYETLSLAIDDAEDLIQKGKPENAYDRIHTTLHGLIKKICDELLITYPDNPSLEQLTGLIRVYFSNLGDDEQEVSKVIAAIGKITKVLNDLRNHNSLAHPTDKLLGKEEALFMINISKSIIKYLNKKLNRA